VVKYSLRVQIFFPLGGVQEANGPPSVNLGAPDISETTIARKLNLKVPLVVKYPHWVQKILYYYYYYYYYYPKG